MPALVPSSTPTPKEISIRDVRDLALAVIEGAVAAEALAKELKRTPDRSKHFQEIAERLRAVVGRPSIRLALADDGSNTVPLTQAAPRVSVQLASPPHLPTQPPASNRSSGEVPTASSVETATLGARIDRLHETLTHGEIGKRLARLEALMNDATTNRLPRVEQALIESTRAAACETHTISTAEGAIRLAGHLTDRLRREPALVVRIEVPRR